jgi:hypothetical protein
MTGESHLNAQTMGYLLGIYEMARTINYMVRALQIKHADDVQVPVDELMSDLQEFLKKGTGEE